MTSRRNSWPWHDFYWKIINLVEQKEKNLQVLISNEKTTYCCHFNWSIFIFHKRSLIIIHFKGHISHMEDSSNDWEQVVFLLIRKPDQVHGVHQLVILFLEIWRFTLQTISTICQIPKKIIIKTLKLNCNI